MKGGRVSFLIFPFFHSISSSHPHIWETSLAARPFKTMELEKAGEIALRLPELPNDYLRLQDRSNRQTAKHSRFYLDRCSQSANSSMRGGYSRVKRAILSRVSRMCETSSTFRSKMKLIPNTIASHTNSIIFPKIEACEKLLFLLSRISFKLSWMYNVHYPSCSVSLPWVSFCRLSPGICDHFLQRIT